MNEVLYLYFWAGQDYVRRIVDIKITKSKLVGKCQKRDLSSHPLLRSFGHGSCKRTSN